MLGSSVFCQFTAVKFNTKFCSLTAIPVDVIECTIVGPLPSLIYQLNIVVVQVIATKPEMQVRGNVLNEFWNAR